jgi:hypothetical protein
MAGKESVTRTVTNVGSRTSTYTASVTGLKGLQTTVTPNKLTLAPGQSGTFKVSFSRTTAAFGTYQSGWLFWKDGQHIVRSPIVVNPAGVDAPVEVSPAANKAFTLTTKSGFTGTMSRRLGGLVASVDTAAEADNSHGAGDPLDPSNYTQPIQVRGPGTILRVQTLPDNAADDLDLFLLDSDDNVVAQAATGASAEQFTVSGLDKGTYTIAVEAFAVAGGGDSTTFTVRTFSVASATGNLSVTPFVQKVQAAKSSSWAAKTSGLDTSKAYLGVVRWFDGTGTSRIPIGNTLVSIG